MAPATRPESQHRHGGDHPGRQQLAEDDPAPWNRLREEIDRCAVLDLGSQRSGAENERGQREERRHDEPVEEGVAAQSCWFVSWLPSR